MKKKTIIISAVAVIGLIILVPIFKKKEKNEYRLNTVVAQRGNVTNSVTATGTVEPIEQVEVGTQVSGVIKKLHVDYNSIVKRGQLLAELDRSTLLARVLQSRASLASAQNELTYQNQNYTRIKTLFNSEMVSETEFENAQYKLNNAKATVDRLKSELEQADVNLAYATILSPIDGIVLDRTVEEGQTVAASFNTPTLFTIARDLTRMQVEANVDEADIGQVREGQRVIFSVDAYPDYEFTGTISQIRLKPTIASSVVTYVVIIEAPNPELKLKPGLTANITVITREENDIITLPVSALAFKPDNLLLKDYKIEQPDFTGKNHAALSVNSNFPGNGNHDKPKMVWVKNGKNLSPIMIETGLTDRAIIAVKIGINVGDTIVTTMEKVSLTGTEKMASSPFMPRPGVRR